MRFEFWCRSTVVVVVVCCFGRRLWIGSVGSSPWAGAVVVVCSDGFVWEVDEFFVFVCGGQWMVLWQILVGLWF